MDISRIGRSIETENGLVVARGWERGMGRDCLMGEGFLFGGMKSFGNT